MIAYEVLTGEKPFAAEYLPTLLYKIVREESAAAAALEPDARHRRWKRVLRKALAKKAPTDAIETCTDFVNALAVA